MSQVRKIATFYLLLSIFLFHSSNVKASTPTNLEETYNFLDSFLPDSVKTKLKFANEDEANVFLHLYAGMAVRKKLDLWNKNAKLSKYFIERGIGHPYYFTDLIFTYYIRHLKHIPENLENLQNLHYYTEGTTIIEGTTIVRNDTGYSAENFFSLRRNFFVKNNLKSLFSVGDSLLIADNYDFVLSQSTPEKQLPLILGRIEWISGDSLNVRILKIKKRKYPKKAGVYPLIYNVNDLFVPLIENCGYLPPKGMGF